MTEITLKMIFRIRNQRLVMDFVHQKTAGNGGFLILTKTMSRAAVGTRTRDLITTNDVRYHLCHSSKTTQDTL